MNRASKLGRKSSDDAAPSKKRPDPKKNPSSRDPLRDLNAATSFPPPPSDTPRGCFRFLLSNPSSSSKGSITRTKSTPRTPKSAPPNPRALISKKPTQNPKSQKNPSKENPSQLGSKNAPKPRSSELVRWRNYRKPSSESSRNPNTELSFDVNLDKNGGNSACTPEKSLSGFNPEVAFKRNGADFTPEKENAQQLSGTPTSNATPPVQASISPELVAVPASAPTPACFAAGHHVVAGVRDQRKCRPRGILTIGGVGRGVEKDSSGELGASLMLPPIEEASIQWLSSPSEISCINPRSSSSSSSKTPHCTGEASVNWLLSPSENSEDSVVRNGLVNQKESVLRTKFSSDLELWKLSRTDFNTAELPELGGLVGLSSFVSESTPSSGIVVSKTPTTGSSISPFSTILQRAAVSSGRKVLGMHEMRGRYRYGSGVENSPYYGDSWGSGNVIAAPSFDSSLRKQEEWPPLELDSVVDSLGTTSLSPKPVVKNGDANYILPLPGVSFQFGCPMTPLNSIDFEHFQKTSRGKASQEDGSDLEGKNPLDSEVRISWREGLESRIFEMGELDSSLWLSDDEDAVNYHGEDKVESKFDVKFDSSNQSSTLKDGKDQHIPEGFGSIEFAHDDICVQKNGANILPVESISCAESISTVCGGLFSSGSRSQSPCIHIEIAHSISSTLYSYCRRT